MSNIGLLPKIDLLIISVTDNCQLHCTYCYQSNYNKFDRTDMSLQDLLALVDFAAENKIPEISLFGGEPLYNLTTQIIPIIQYISSKYKDDILLSFVSNGLGFTRELVDVLEQSGIKWKILISFDGEYDLVKQHMTKTQYDTIRNNIESLTNKEKENVMLKVTMDDDGLKTAGRTYQFLQQLGIQVIQMNPILEANEEEVISASTQLKDAKIIDKNIRGSNPFSLFAKDGLLTVGGFTYTNNGQCIVGVFNNGIINLLDSYMEKIPTYLKNGKNNRAPYNKEWCNDCSLKDKYCFPVEPEPQFSKIPCLWDNLMKENRNV